MNNFLRMCLNIITQIGPYLVVLLLLKYLVNLQQKRAKEREEEQKKGIIRTHYIIKTEKVLTMFFVLAVFLFGGATVASAIQQDDLLPPIGFSIFFIVSLIGSLNMIKEREEEQKKGIIRTHYIIKTEKVLTMFFVLAVFLFGGATVASAIQQDDLLPPIGFSIFFIVSLIGSLNMIMWKLEVNGDEITWRSTFGRKRTFHFEDITYCERKKGSMRVYVNGEKLFTIDSNIDKEEFMEDIKRRRIPVKSYWANQHKKNRK